MPAKEGVTDPAIRTERLTKYYGGARGIEGLDLTVDRGQIFGFLAVGDGLPALDALVMGSGIAVLVVAAVVAFDRRDVAV